LALIDVTIVNISIPSRSATRRRWTPSRGSERLQHRVGCCWVHGLADRVRQRQFFLIDGDLLVGRDVRTVVVSGALIARARFRRSARRRWRRSRSPPALVFPWPSVASGLR
jgi:hypothetical protein